MPKSVPIRPHVGVFALFSAVDYKAWYALAELVDNSVQSLLDNVDALRALYGDEPSVLVTIDTDDSGEDVIKVTDNAGGISADRFETAFQVAVPPPDQSGLSVYGIGLKSAAAWFGDYLRVVTTALGEAVEREIVFDFPTIVREGIESLDVVERSAPVDAHGTSVEMRRLHHPIQGRTHEKVRHHLASIYRSFLRDGRLILLYRGEQVTFEDPEVLVAAAYGEPSGAEFKWRKDIDITLDSGERVHGFAGIRKRGYTPAPGFALFRGDRVITGIEDDPWRPVEIFGPPNKFAAQRLFGELHLENVRVSYSKNGFIWQAAEEEVIQRLRGQLDAEPLSLIKQATHYRARTAERSQEAAAIQALSNTAEALSESAGPVLAEETGIAPTANDPLTLPHGPLTASRTVDLQVDDVTWSINVEIVNDEATSPWLEIAQTHAEELTVQLRLNLAHAFSKQFGGSDTDDIEVLVRAAAALGLAVVASRVAGVEYARTVLRIFNQLLARALSGVGEA